MNLYTWKRTSGYASSSLIYPQRDHTTNNIFGSYAAFETTGKPNGTVSQLLGPTFNPITDTTCRMRFHYFMTGKSAGQLAVYFREAVGSGFTSLWSKQGDSGDVWVRAEVPMRTTKKPIQIIVEAMTSGSSPNEPGIIAIDDVSFTTTCSAYAGVIPTFITSTTQSPCGPNGYRCSDGQCIDKNKVCDFTQDCSRGEDENECGICNFESDSCGWYDSSFGAHQWSRAIASETNITTDHTVNAAEGAFMYYAQAFGTFAGLTRLTSPRLAQTGSHCDIEFYYYKDDATALSFGLYLTDANGYSEKLWVTRETKGKQWNRMSVGVNKRQIGFNFYFEAIQLSENANAQLAIDDVNFINCQAAPNTSCSAANVFKCANGYCIPNNLVSL